MDGDTYTVIRPNDNTVSLVFELFITFYIFAFQSALGSSNSRRNFNNYEGQGCSVTCTLGFVPPSYGSFVLTVSFLIFFASLRSYVSRKTTYPNNNDKWGAFECTCCYICWQIFTGASSLLCLSYFCGSCLFFFQRVACILSGLLYQECLMEHMSPLHVTREIVHHFLSMVVVWIFSYFHFI